MTLEAPAVGFVRARALVLGGTVAAFAAARAYAPYAHDGPVLCLLRGLTGVPCPGCGLTRAFCALAQGEVVAALEWNACALPLALLALAASAVAALELARGTAFRFYRAHWLRSWNVAWGAAAVVGVYHVGRCAYWAANGALFSSS